MQSEQTRQSDFIEPPMYGGIVCLAASNSLVIFDMTSMAGSPGNQVNGVDQGVYGGKDQNPLGHYVTMQADGGDIYIAFGDTVGHLNGIANTTSVSSVASNAISPNNTTAGVIKIPNGTERAFKLPVGSNPQGTPWGANSPCRFLAFIMATGTGTLRMWQSSP